MTAIIVETENAEQTLRQESAVVGKYRQIGQLRASRSRFYAATISLSNAA